MIREFLANIIGLESDNPKNLPVIRFTEGGYSSRPTNLHEVLLHNGTVTVTPNRICKDSLGWVPADCPVRNLDGVTFWGEVAVQLKVVPGFMGSPDILPTPNSRRVEVHSSVSRQTSLSVGDDPRECHQWYAAVFPGHPNAFQYLVQHQDGLEAAIPRDGTLTRQSLTPGEEIYKAGYSAGKRSAQTKREIYPPPPVDPQKEVNPQVGI